MGRNLHRNSRGGELIDHAFTESRYAGVSNRWVNDVKNGGKTREAFPSYYLLVLLQDVFNFDNTLAIVIIINVTVTGVMFFLVFVVTFGRP